MADVGRELNKLVALPTSTRAQGTRHWAWTLLVKTVDPDDDFLPGEAAATSEKESHAILNYVAPPIH